MKRKLSNPLSNLACASLMLVVVVFCGCNNIQPTSETIAKDSSNVNNIKADWGMDVKVRLIEVDSCEYLVSTRQDAISTIHKQNCKYCADRSKK